jgi:hypothetical protein
MHRAGEHARRWIGTVNTPGGLQHGSFGIQRYDDILEIANPFLGCSYVYIQERHIRASLTVDSQEVALYGLHF